MENKWNHYSLIDLEFSVGFAFLWEENVWLKEYLKTDNLLERFLIALLHVASICEISVTHLNELIRIVSNNNNNNNKWLVLKIISQTNLKNNNNNNNNNEWKLLFDFVLLNLQQIKKNEFSSLFLPISKWLCYTCGKMFEANQLNSTVISVSSLWGCLLHNEIWMEKNKKQKEFFEVLSCFNRIAIRLHFPTSTNDALTIEKLFKNNEQIELCEFIIKKY